MDIIISCSRRSLDIGGLNCGSLSAPVRIGKAGYVEQVLAAKATRKPRLAIIIYALGFTALTVFLFQNQG